MQPGGGYLYRSGNGNGSGFRYGPYDSPPVPPPEQQKMTPQEKEAIIMAAGRLAAEYLVIRGDLPPSVLENRPPAPIPSLGAAGGQQPAFGSQYHYHYHQQPPLAGTSHFQGRPPAPQQRQAQAQAQAWPHTYPFHWQGQQQQRPPARFPGRRPFRGGRGRGGPFPKWPRQQRPFVYGPPSGPAPPQAQNVGDAQPTAQPEVPAASGSQSQQTNEPSSSSLGANNASESSQKEECALVSAEKSA